MKNNEKAPNRTERRTGIRDRRRASIEQESSPATGWSWTLRFPDRDMESSYLRDEFVSHRRWVIGSLFVGLASTLLFYPLDELFVAPGVLPLMHELRLLLLAPLPLLGIVGLALIDGATAAMSLTLVLLTLYGLAWTAILSVVGPASEPYLVLGVANTILFAYICLALPFRLASIAVAVIVLPFLALSAWQGLEERFIWYSVVSLFTVWLIASYGCLRYELVSRDRFLGRQRLEHEYARRLASERERVEWLSLVAGFTRHELRNAMAGIGTSLQLLERTEVPGDGATYVERATRSLDFMRGVLRKVADATSLEAALEAQEMRDVDLSRLVAERAEDFRREAAPRRCEVTVCEGVHVHGSPDSLLQMLDKLLNNALEHSPPDGLVSVSLERQPDRARLEVMNFGVPLPSDVDRLFRPLVSLRTPGEQGHLGLGLYVAQVIANRHGGAIRAEPTPDRPGARFIVELPSLQL
jgi:signal transduction histidine kinase